MTEVKDYTLAKVSDLSGVERGGLLRGIQAVQPAAVNTDFARG